MLDLRSEFMCKGNLCFPDGTTFKASGLIKLTVESEIDCVLELEVQADPLLLMVQQANIDPPQHLEFVGTTDGGQPIVATGLSMRSKEPLGYATAEVTIGSLVPVPSIRFFFPNLNMTPSYAYVREPTRAYSVAESWVTRFPKTLGHGRAEFSVCPDLREVQSSAKEEGRSVITVAATLTKSVGPLEWGEVEEPMYRLCLLFSLASGRHINWAVAQSSEWWVYRRHERSGWEGRGATVWIKSFPESVKALLDCWPRICALSTNQALAFQRAVRLLLHSGPTFSFPVPFYCTAGAFETLCQAFLRGSKSGFLPSKTIFREVRRSFEKWIRDHFEPEVADQSLIKEFREARNNKFDAINSRNLRHRIVALAQQENLVFSEESVGKFVKIRNEMTHGKLKSMDEWDLFTILAPVDDLLVRILLRLVGFKGEYWGGSDGFGTMRPLE